MRTARPSSRGLPDHAGFHPAPDRFLGHVEERSDLADCEEDLPDNQLETDFRGLAAAAAGAFMADCSALLRRWVRNGACRLG